MQFRDEKPRKILIRQSTQVDYYNDIKRESGTLIDRPTYPRGRVPPRSRTESLAVTQTTPDPAWPLRSNLCKDIVVHREQKEAAINDLFVAGDARYRPKRRRRT